MNYKREMDRALLEEIEHNQTHLSSALVIHRGKEVYYNHFGYADAEKKIPMQRDTIIRLYSMSKPITAAAVMLLIERGQLDFIDPISKYLPEYAHMTVLDNNGNETAAGPITVMNLLTMTSGIPYGENWEGCSLAGRKMQDLFDELLDGLNKGERLSTREVVRKIAQVPLCCNPGERWVYGLSADLLGAIVEVVTGERYSAFLQREIFDKLNMPDTGFCVPKEKRDRFAMDYEWKEGTQELVACDESHLLEYYGEDIAFESGGAGMVSTIDDYSHFARMLAGRGVFGGKRILSSRSVDFMRENHLTQGQMAALDWESNRGYGYGCLMRVLCNRTKAGTLAPLGEFGWDGWTGNYVCMDAENDLVMIYFMQRRGAWGISAIRKMRALTYASLDNWE